MTVKDRIQSLKPPHIKIGGILFYFVIAKHKQKHLYTPTDGTAPSSPKTKPNTPELSHFKSTAARILALKPNHINKGGNPWQNFENQKQQQKTYEFLSKWEETLFKAVKAEETTNNQVVNKARAGEEETTRELIVVYDVAIGSLGWLVLLEGFKS